MNTTRRPPTRRQFLAGTTSLAAAGSLVSMLGSRAYAGSDQTLRIGLVGCGGRGTGAAIDALMVDPNTKLVAMADLFADRIEGPCKALSNHKDVGARVDVPPERRYAGFDAYRQVIDQVDVVLLATSPHYRPIHLKYAVEKGVHAFVEKPVATDAPMLRDIAETCRLAESKNLSIVSGLCWRYHLPKVETMKRVLDGQIGRIVAIETVYNTGTLWHRGSKPQWTPMEYQNRNWYYFTWLSGDHICEQAIHSLDKMGWAMGDQPPAWAYGVGGRQVRTDPKYGNIFDHFSIFYQYPNGVRGYHQCRQIAGAANRVRDYIFGTEGIADIFGHRLVAHDGTVLWKYEGPAPNMYRHEHVRLFQSIRSGQPINNGRYMCSSTMLAIMGRLAAYTGKQVTWEQAWNNTVSLAPQRYDFGPAPERPVATPGKTPLEPPKPKPKAATAGPRHPKPGRKTPKPPQQ